MHAQTSLAKTSEHDQLRLLVGVMVWSSLPLLVFSIYVGFVSGSLSVVAVLLHGGISLLLNCATYFVLRIVSRSNLYQFPYGTGKLESFTSFFLGCGLVLVGGTILHQGLQRLSSPPATVSLGLAQFVFLGSVLRLAFLVWWLARMVRRNTERAPLLHAYYVNCSASLWHACGMMLAMLAGWLLSQLWGQIICVVVDLSVAAFFTGYLLWKGVRVICANFRSLIDLPLPEPDQIKILQVLARHYDAYTHLGQIFTRLSGGQRRIEIELSLSPDTTACQIEGLREQLRNELGKCFGRVEFQLLARCPSAPVGNS